ncbi:MAG: DEAD/DEAH box helicase family protein [Candidatus Thiodiazotropha sp. (ex Ctena orbiculata)]|nr:DEAD/DEAH box helicase family protein [Candidatus Thiodiazotropha sp. (ex Codakia orbicularis)]MBV2127214.1 DEAD/DEAH box helicase family protein [Candidatus Thiodiazotropha taylori]
MTPPEETLLETQTREAIDRNLTDAGWVIQDKKRINLYESLGVAVREMDTDTGPADYMLFIDGKACGIIEAKREGTDLGGVAEQSARYATSHIKFIERWVAEDQPLPLLYEATNHEIRFRDERDPHPRSRNIFHFHRPETLLNWLQDEETLRARLQQLPGLNTENLRNCQIDAIKGIEHSLKQGKPRALLQMATGSGKTYTAVTQVYRLAKFAKIKRALFLVDRGNLATNAKDEFEQFVIPHDGRKFTQHYNVNILGRAGIPDATKVTISTIQRLYSQLTGQELDDEADEHSGFEVEASTVNKEPRPVSYNPDIPIEEFDVIIIDECHRSIYNLWRQVLEYFDAFLIGLTATPTKKTIGFFGQNLVSEYTHEDAVVDKVNVGYDIYRIKTELTEQGNKIDAGTAVEIRDRLTKQKRLEVLDQEEEWLARQLDRSVLAPNQIRTVIQAYKDNCLPECFPERNWKGSSEKAHIERRMEWVPKTLVFAKDDDHCDRVVDAVREVFDEGNAFCKKITYKVGKKTAEESIKAFRTDPQYRIAVTVDMIATGTDIRPLECVMFMRDVKSQAYYEQMKGRGTRIISRDELHKVTPDAPGKSRFVLVDCVGVTETDKTETKSLETKPSVSTAKLMEQVARGDRHSDTLRALGNRMIRLDLKLNDQQRKRVNELAGKPLALIAGELIHATNEDHLIEAAKIHAKTEQPDEKQIQEAFKPKADILIKPFHNPDLRELLEEYRKETEQLIDDSADKLISAGYDEEKAEVLIQSWQQFIQDHKNELDAIQLIYQQPYQKRHLSYEQIEKLAEEIQQPPYNLAPIEVWKAYEQLEKNKVKGVPPKDLLTNIVSLIRFSTGLSDVLEPFTELVNNRFDNWLKQQGKDFQPEQLAWLNKIKDQIAQNAEMTVEDFNYIPFNQGGGLLKARELFGKDLDNLIQELNGYLIA